MRSAGDAGTSVWRAGVGHGIPGVGLDARVWSGETGSGDVIVARGRETGPGGSRAAKRTRSLSRSGTLAGPEGLMKRLVRGERTGAAGDTPATAVTAGELDSVDSTSVDRDSNCMDVVDSACRGAGAEVPATENTPRDMNVVDMCVHVCLTDNVNIYVEGRTNRVVGESLTSAEVRGRL